MTLPPSPLLCIIFVGCTWNFAAISAARSLSFREDGTFTIAFVTDLHYGEDADLDEQTEQVQRTILSEGRPDFVIFGGDMVSGWKGQGQIGWMQKNWEKFTSPVRDAGIPYTVILGNHDAESGEFSRHSILRLDSFVGGDLSHTRLGPLNITGASNYYIDISGFETTRAAARLWFFDSMVHSCGRAGARSWGCVGRDTISWARLTYEKLPYVSTSMAFVHIPIPEIISVWRSPWTKGTRGEESACPLENTGLYQFAQEAGIDAVWSGHDHNNDYFGQLGSVIVGYGRKSGYGSYGPAGLTHGARVIRLQLPGRSTAAADMQTWVLNEHGVRELPTYSGWPKSRPQPACSEGHAGLQPVLILVVVLTVGVLFEYSVC